MRLKPTSAERLPKNAVKIARLGQRWRRARAAAGRPSPRPLGRRRWPWPWRACAGGPRRPALAGLAVLRWRKRCAPSIFFIRNRLACGAEANLREVGQFAPLHISSIWVWVMYSRANLSGATRCRPATLRTPHMRFCRSLYSLLRKSCIYF